MYYLNDLLKPPLQKSTPPTFLFLEFLFVSFSNLPGHFSYCPVRKPYYFSSVHYLLLHFEHSCVFWSVWFIFCYILNIVVLKCPLVCWMMPNSCGASSPICITTLGGGWNFSDHYFMGRLWQLLVLFSWLVSTEQCAPRLAAWAPLAEVGSAHPSIRWSLWLIPGLTPPRTFIGFSYCSPLCLYFLFVPSTWRISCPWIEAWTCSLKLFLYIIPILCFQIER